LPDAAVVNLASTKYELPDAFGSEVVAASIVAPLLLTQFVRLATPLSIPNFPPYVYPVNNAHLLLSVVEVGSPLIRPAIAVPWSEIDELALSK